MAPVEKQVEAKKANGFSEKQVEAKKADNDNEDDNENADENDDVSEKRPTLPRKKFVPHTLDGIETYCAENGYHIDAQHFINYYTANGWKVGKNPMKDWQAAVRMWAMRDAHGGGFSKRNDGDILSDAVEACRRYEWKKEAAEMSESLDKSDIVKIITLIRVNFENAYPCRGGSL